jgi:hypothetical protein
MMSEEMLALLCTVGIFLVLAAWIPLLELLSRLAARRALAKMTTRARVFKVRQRA